MPMLPTLRSWTLLGLLALAGMAGPLAAQERVRVGMDPRSAPWAFVPGEDYSAVDFHAEPSLSRAQVGQIVGISADVSEALTKELGCDLVIVPTSYYTLEPALLDGDIDLIINAFNRTRDTPAAIRVSESYYQWGLLIAVRASDSRIRSLADLRGMTVGHFKSQLVNRTLHSLGAKELKGYENEEEMFADLETGGIDAVVYDSPAVRWRARNDPAIKAVGDPLNKLGYHVGLRAADEELFTRVQAAIRSLTSAGAFEAIRRKWEQPDE